MKRLAFGLFLVLANPGFVAAAPAAGTGETADEKASEAEAPATEVPEAKKDELPDLSDEVKEAATEKEEATAAATAAQHDVTVRVAGGTHEGRAAIGIDAEEAVRLSR